jgi:hypothetical protein
MGIFYFIQKKKKKRKKKNGEGKEEINEGKGGKRQMREREGRSK